MLKRLRTAHPILYCILSEVLFLGSMVVFSLLATIVLAAAGADFDTCLLYTSPSPRDKRQSRMPSSA